MKQSIENNLSHAYVNTNGIKLHYVTQGNGSLMLMVHGFPEFWYSWRYQIAEFSQDFKVVALDLRGYNESDKPQRKSAYVMQEFVEDIKGVITGLGYEKCILIAHDWGALIAWNFAYEYPKMVDKLVILNVPHPKKMASGLRTKKQLIKSWYIFFFQLPFLPEIFLKNKNYKFIEKAFIGTAIDKSCFTPEDIQAYKNAISKPGALTATINYYRNIFSKLFSGNSKKSKFQKLEIPTLMIWGEEDKFLGKELTYGTQAYIKDFQVKYIPNCSHWVQQEKPELVNQYIREFLLSEGLKDKG